MILTVIGWTLMSLGAAWMVLSTIGMHRMRTPMARMQVAGKAATFGVVACLVGAAMVVEDTAGSARLVLAAVMLLITVPGGTQALAGAHAHVHPDTAGPSREDVRVT